jgi:hypothetical protein
VGRLQRSQIFELKTSNENPKIKNYSRRKRSGRRVSRESVILEYYNLRDCIFVDRGYEDEKQDLVCGGDLPFLSSHQEYLIVDHLLGFALRDEVVKIIPMQKHTTAGTSILDLRPMLPSVTKIETLVLDFRLPRRLPLLCPRCHHPRKMILIPVRRGFWGHNNVDIPHTVPCKVTSKCGSVRVRLIPPLSQEAVEQS